MAATLHQPIPTRTSIPTWLETHGKGIGIGTGIGLGMGMGLGLGLGDGDELSGLTVSKISRTEHVRWGFDRHDCNGHFDPDADPDSDHDDVGDNSADSVDVVAFGSSSSDHASIYATPQS